MADDHGNKIPVQVVSFPVQLDEDIQSNSRFIFGYFTGVYDTDEDVTIELYAVRGDDKDDELVDTFTLDKDKNRFRRKVKLVGSVIDFYIKLTGSFTEFEASTLKLSYKVMPVGKY